MNWMCLFFRQNGGDAYCQEQESSVPQLFNAPCGLGRAIYRLLTTPTDLHFKIVLKESITGGNIHIDQSRNLQVSRRGNPLDGVPPEMEKRVEVVLEFGI